MTILKLQYDADSPRDVTDFLKMITELWVSKNSGPSRARRHVQLMLGQTTNQSNIRRFLEQAYFDLNRQLPLTTDRSQYALKMEIADLLGKTSRGWS